MSFGQIVADQPRHLLPDRFGRGRIAFRPLLDHALQHRDGEGHTGRLQRLEIDRREQPRLFRIALIGRRVADDGLDIADALALGRGKRLRRIVLLAERADGRERCGDVEHTIAAHGDHGRAIRLRQPDAADKRSPRAVLGKKVLYRQCRHGRILALFGSAALAEADHIGEDQ
ncbi:hypothetical protein ACVWWO_008401 [Bradyrhizobium sp. F1.13.1]